MRKYLVIVLSLITGCASASNAAEPTTRPAIAEKPIPPDQMALADLPMPPLPTVTTQPSTQPSAEALGWYGQGMTHLREGQPREAVAAMEQALAADPDSPAILLGLAEAELPIDQAQSVAHLEQAAKLDPQSIFAHLQLARIALVRGETDTALKRLQFARQTTAYLDEELPGLETDFLLARTLEARQQWKAAIEMYGKLAEALANPPIVVRREVELARLAYQPELLIAKLGELHERLGDEEAALASFRELAGDRPDNAVLNNAVIRILLKLNRNEEAAAAAEDVVVAADADPASLALMQGTFASIGRADEVNDRIQVLAEGNPSKPLLALAWAEVLVSTDRSDQALQVLEQALESSPGEERLVRRYVRLQEDPSPAARAVVRMAGADPNSFRAAYNLMSQLLMLTRPQRLTVKQLRELPVEEWAQPAQMTLVAAVAEYQGRTITAHVALEEVLDQDITYGPAVRQALSGDAEANARLIERVSRRSSALADELRGKLAQVEGKPEAALRYFQRSAERGNRSPDLRLAEMQAMLQNGQDAEFEALARVVLLEFPLYDPAYSLYGGYLNKNGRYEDLVRLVLAWGDADPQAVEPIVSKVNLMRFRNRPQAEQLLLQLLRARPHDPNVADAVSGFYRVIERPEEAIAPLTQLAAKEPANLAVVSALNALLREMGRAAEADRVLDAAAEAVTTADTAYTLGLMFDWADMPDKSIQLLERAVEIDPSHAPAANDLGYRLAVQNRDLPRAEKLVEAALEGEPDHPAYLDSLGWVRYKLGDFADASELLERAMAAGAEDDPVVLDHYGDALMRQDKAEGAKAAWAKSKAQLDKLNDAEIRLTDEQRRVRLSVEAKLAALSGDASPETSPTGAEASTRPATSPTEPATAPAPTDDAPATQPVAQEKN